jgi:hypothetical protein
MASSLKDALVKSGLTPADPPPSKPRKGWREELPDDETLPLAFEAPPLTTAVDPSAPPPTRKP